MAYITHNEGNQGQAPEIGIHTNLGAQYTQAALENWRAANPWAAHIPWEELPEYFRDTVEIAAGILAGAGHASRYRDMDARTVNHEDYDGNGREKETEVL